MSHAHTFAAEMLGDATPASGEPQPVEPEVDRAIAAVRSQAAIPPPMGSPRAPWIAALLALFPGLGSIYNGSYARGVAFFLAVFGSITLANEGNDLFGFAVAFLWLFNVIDAYREARLIRSGLAADLGLARRRPAASSVEGLGLGALLFVIGLLSFLDLTLGLDVEWVYDLWPLALMAFGAWFVVAAIRRGRAEQSRPEASAFDRADQPPAATQPEE